MTDFQVRKLSDYTAEDLFILHGQICNRVTDIKYNMKDTEERADILKCLDIWLYRIKDAHKMSTQREYEQKEL